MNKEKLLYERALITCVVMLFVCIVLKTFGVEWFNLDTGIPLLNKIDEIVMNSVLLSFLYNLLFVSINNFLLLGVISVDEPKTVALWTLKFIPLNALFILLKSFVFNNFIIDILILFIMTTIIKSEYKNLIITIVLSVVYQLISLLIRNVSLGYFYSFCLGFLLNIDYYIMLSITYLYLKKGDFDLCSVFRVISSSLRTKLWKKHSQSSNPCSDKG